MAKKHTTKIRKGIGRKIQPKQFESLEITVAYEDTINWDTKEERDSQLAKATEMAIEDFEKTFNSVLEDLGVAPKSATVTHKADDGSVKSGALPTSNDSKKPKPMSEDELEDIFDGVSS